MWVFCTLLSLAKILARGYQPGVAQRRTTMSWISLCSDKYARKAETVFGYNLSYSFLRASWRRILNDPPLIHS